jgi:hypothetical protein
MQGWRPTREGHFHLTLFAALSEGSDVIQVITLLESEYIRGNIMTNTQYNFEILHDGPLLTSDPVLGEITMVGECEEVIYSLLHQFVNNERIDHGGKNVQVTFRKVG